MRITTYEEVQNLLREYSLEQQELRSHIVSIMWHMRGSLSREEAWALSPVERLDIHYFIQERWKLVKDTKLPLI